MADDIDFDAQTDERDLTKIMPGSVADLILNVWDSGTDAEVYRVLATEAAPRLKSHLRRKYSLQEADCEDCLSSAYDSFAPAVRSRGSLSNPYAYFFRIGINAALGLLREQQLLVERPWDAVGLARKRTS